MAELLFRRVNIRVNAVDSLIAFREITSSSFGYTKKDEVAETVFGTTIYREEESIEPLNTLSFLLNEYINLGINKYFGITVIEYVNLTRPEKYRMNKVAKDKSMLEQKLLEDAKNKNREANVMFDDMGMK